jgi:hypothetical protein
LSNFRRLVRYTLAPCLLHRTAGGIVGPEPRRAGLARTSSAGSPGPHSRTVPLRAGHTQIPEASMPAFAPRRLIRGASAVAALSLAACAHNPAPREMAPSSNVITAQEIAAWGSRDAWEVLRRSGKVQLRESAGEPVRMVSDRGRTSLMLDDSPMVLLDGMRVGDVDILRYVRASSIAEIRFLNSVQGTIAYGTGAVSGVIEIYTKQGGQV